MPSKEVVIICTRNRVNALEESLRSLFAQESTLPVECHVIDSSDPEFAAQIEKVCSKVGKEGCIYHQFLGKPSLARQRDFAIDLFTDEVDLLHFIDDDVTLLPGYLREIRESFNRDPELLGLGPSIEKPNRDKGGIPYRLFSFVFLLEHPRVGAVFPSGGESVAQNLDLDRATEVDCLGGCNCYRLDVIKRIRPDSQLEGYSLDEDLDWSYRIGKEGKLIVQPKARFIHHEAPQERHEVAKMARERLIHRYWFVEKNIDSILRKPAFWWSILGLLLRTFISSNSIEKEKRKGILDGIRIVRNRDHALLGRAH